MDAQNSLVVTYGVKIAWLKSRKLHVFTILNGMLPKDNVFRNQIYDAKKCYAILA